MGAETHGQDRAASGIARAKPRWHYVYFLLAAFDLVTVLAGLTLNHRIMSIYVKSVEANRVWADRVAAYSHLGELAGDVDAPGNDVFDTRDVQKESLRMGSAVKAFDLDLQKQRRELQADLDPGSGAPLLALLDAIAVANAQMTQEAGRIFDYFREGRADLAGERMATMDHKYASLNAALLELRRAVGKIQQQNFAEQTAAAASLQRYEYGIGLSIVLMVLGATFYGHKIARQMQFDADERERNYTAVRAAETRTRSILETAAEGIVSFDDEGRIEVFNRAAEQLFGEDGGGAIGRDIRSMIPAITECMEAADSYGATDLTPRRLDISGGDRIGVRRDGTQFPIEFSVSTASVGLARTFTAIVRDISDRRKAEEALAVAAAAQAANLAKSRFLANMSHEIRTPMSGVLGMAEMLLDTSLTQTQRRYAESVHRSGESLLKILDGILDFSKIEAGKVELERIEFQPRELLDEVTDLLREGADRKGLTLTCRVAAEVPDTLLGAPSRLRQILINLVGNAIKFTDAGRVAVSVSTLDAGPEFRPRTRLQAALPRTHATTVLHVIVEDTGIGIDDGAQDRLFRAFEQADSSTTRSYGGTGLGLAISRELIEQMGGRIGVRSAPRRGSEFWFSLPLERPLGRGAAHPLQPVSGNAGSGVAGVRVLLAEDNAINQDVARAMLQSLGCHVHVVDTGVKALAALDDFQFDIVLMDRQMPEMDGFDTTAEIRARRLLRPAPHRVTGEPVPLPVVGLTASALKGDREMCIAAGMDDYLAKPYRREALRRLLEQWALDGVAARQDGPAAVPEAPIATLDRATLDQVGSLPRGAAPRLVSGLIDDFFAEGAGLIEALTRAALAADGAALAHAARALERRSEFIGARRLAGLCGDLAVSGATAQTHATERALASIRQEYELVCVAMKAVNPARQPG